MQTSNLTSEPASGGGLQSLVVFLAKVGVTRSTVWRWQKNGWIRLTNIAGKNYVSDEDAAEFVRRAQAGEFSKKPVVPVRSTSQ